LARRSPPRLADGFAISDYHQQAPKLVAVIQLREISDGSASTHAVKGTERYIFFVGGTSKRLAKLVAGQFDEFVKIALPQRLGGGRVPGLES
jgi:hypothetical protein